SRACERPRRDRARPARPRERRARPSPPSTPRLRARPSSPDVLSRLDDGPQLRAFILDAESVSQDGGGEAALRRESELLEREEASCITDARRELLDCLPARGLGGHEPENRGLVLGHGAQGLEVAGAFVVVLEQEPLGVDLGEK